MIYSTQSTPVFLFIYFCQLDFIQIAGAVAENRFTNKDWQLATHIFHCVTLHYSFCGGRNLIYNVTFSLFLTSLISWKLLACCQVGLYRLWKKPIVHCTWLEIWRVFNSCVTVNKLLLSENNKYSQQLLHNNMYIQVSWNAAHHFCGSQDQY